MDLSCATIACVAILARRTALAIHVRSQFVYVHIYGLHSQELYMYRGLCCSRCRGRRDDRYGQNGRRAARRPLSSATSASPTSTRERRGAAPTTACTLGAANRQYDPQLRPCRGSPRQPPKESFDNQRVENREAQCECNTYKKHFKKKEKKYSWGSGSRLVLALVFWPAP